jgi:hypothetical protein
MTKSETQTNLDINIPESVIKSRSQGGVSLSYLEAWYVKDTLNQELGQGNWGYQIKELKVISEEDVDGSFIITYGATVSLFATIDGKTVIFDGDGSCEGRDKKVKGRAHDLSRKGSVSDAFKRAACNLGRSMGLALYDKTKEFVGEASTKIDTDPGRTVVIVTSSEAQRLDIPNNGSAKDTIKSETATNGNDSKVLGGSTNGKLVKELIASSFKVLEAQKKITKDEFKTKYQKGAGLSTLSEPTLQFILNSLKTDFPELGL